MTDQEALGMVWHMASMWLCKETQRFQQHSITNEQEDCLELLLARDRTEVDAEEALDIIHRNHFQQEN